MDEEDFGNYFESERFLFEREDDDILKSKDPEIINWDKVNLEGLPKYLTGDTNLYQTFQKSLREGAPVYELDVDGKQHASAKIMFLDKGALFLKESTKKSAEKEGFVYNLAKMAKLDQHFEQACSTEIDGKFYAVSNMMPSNMKSLTTWKKSLPEALDGLLMGAAKAGITHKLAVFNAVTSNLDQHRGNVFTDGEQIKLIDQGRTFVPHGKVYVPGYLRKNDETLIKSGDDDSVRLWLGSIRSDSRLFIFHAFIDKLNISYGDNVCNKITDCWDALALGRK